MDEKLAKIKLLLLDVDGIMTDGRIIYDNQGNELKAFDVKDGHGLKMIQRAGIKIGIITGRESGVVARRAAELGIDILYQKALTKLDPYKEILGAEGLTDEQVAYMGDDVVDLPILRRVGFSATVADAVPDVLPLVDYVATRPGGRGAVREVCDMLLRASGQWEELTERYFKA
ncbi:3-deoxy-D-manno-octulosonate 8-phosphate phosphatase (KDO 8-P phosphatase) [Malonomonas rubra DSM 5091]|uniref:3-deoxy-D-manno-octulosonate 8-phosphate phosphatase (KDO 8-P phosphatase) n=1 Tax=Malonomonas rubra DSM 5091 TaxID=1122189 RepID=A0A1M6DY22_MALRU|nr:HAD-IIIA family hydrolase [Malonomonas rubra]SHI78187.1 3-deoxy-D-manno-octulosonate 8-phosphate phosphatase (KDO 8-P phosphatase) [Malonomonas rubra DSM 5091]